MPGNAYEYFGDCEGSQNPEQPQFVNPQVLYSNSGTTVSLSGRESIPREDSQLEAAYFSMGVDISNAGYQASHVFIGAGSVMEGPTSVDPHRMAPWAPERSQGGQDHFYNYPENASLVQLDSSSSQKQSWSQNNTSAAPEIHIQQAKQGDWTSTSQDETMPAVGGPQDATSAAMQPLSPSSDPNIAKDIQNFVDCSVPWWLSQLIDKWKANNPDLNPLDLCTELISYSKSFKNSTPQPTSEHVIENVATKPSQATTLVSSTPENVEDRSGSQNTAPPSAETMSDIYAYAKKASERNCSKENKQKGEAKCINTLGCQCSFPIEKKSEYEHHFWRRYPQEYWPCPGNGCRRISYRKDHLGTHLNICKLYKDGDPINLQEAKPIRIPFERMCGFCNKNAIPSKDSKLYITHVIDHFKNGSLIENWVDHDNKMLILGADYDTKPGLVPRNRPSDDGDEDYEPEQDRRRRQPQSETRLPTAKRQRTTKSGRSQASSSETSHKQAYFELCLRGLVPILFRQPNIINSSLFKNSLSPINPFYGASTGPLHMGTNLDFSLDGTLKQPSAEQSSLTTFIEKNSMETASDTHSMIVMCFLKRRDRVEMIALGLSIWEQTSGRLPSQGIEVIAM